MGTGPGGDVRWGRVGRAGEVGGQEKVEDKEERSGGRRTEVGMERRGMWMAEGEKREGMYGRCSNYSNKVAGAGRRAWAILNGNGRE